MNVHHWVTTALFALVTAAGPCVAQQTSGSFGNRLVVSGSYKNLLTISRTPVLKDDFWSDLNRLKLDFDFDISETSHIKAIVDNELLLGSLLETTEFRLGKEPDSGNRWDLDHIFIDNDKLYGRINVYRLYLNLDFRHVDVTAGRQRIAWGTGRLWNPTDLFNPISPLQIERNQRDGVDALNVEFFPGALSSLSLVYAAGDKSRNDSFGFRAGSNFKGYDYSVMAGEFRQDRVVGFDFGGNIGDAGFRGEATYTQPDEGENFWRGVLSWDYSFQSTLYLLFEYLYNGGNTGRPDESLQNLTNVNQRSFSGEIVTQNRNFVAMGLGYEWTPLLRTDGLMIYDVDDGSAFFGPSVTYNLRSDLDWITGLQLFAGPRDSEYGDSSNLLYSSIQFFF